MEGRVAGRPASFRRSRLGIRRLVGAQESGLLAGNVVLSP